MVESVLISMNPGGGENSYANNSHLTRSVISKTRPILEDGIKEMFKSIPVPTCFKVADLGCSFGSTTLLVISQIMGTIYEICKERNCKSPEFQVFLNDLPANDFNYLFKSLPSYYEKLREEKGDSFGPCFISGVPGSFYGRLFPSTSLNFFHSTSSVHWLSKVPENISNNKGNVYMAKSSPPNVFKAYSEQFQKDFSMFISSRSKEIVPGGGMFLTILSRSSKDPTCKDSCHLWELLTKSLLDLAAKGLVEEADIDTFNLPCYTPHEEEIRAIIEKEGSFDINKLDQLAVNWDPNDDVNNKNFVFDKHQSGRRVINHIRAAIEQMLASHFGENIMDELFKRFAEHVAEHLSVEKTKHICTVLTVMKK